MTNPARSCAGRIDRARLRQAESSLPGRLRVSLLLALDRCRVATIGPLPGTVVVLVSWLRRRARPASTSENGSAGDWPLIELRNVVKTYLGAAGAYPALKGISLRVHAAEVGA